MDLEEIIGLSIEYRVTLFGLVVAMASALGLYLQPEFIQWTQQLRQIALAGLVVGAVLVLYDLWER
jgi:nitrate/nitrite transporter NarK